jgi:hypothetical protein
MRKSKYSVCESSMKLLRNILCAGLALLYAVDSTDAYEIPNHADMSQQALIFLRS